MKKTYLVTGGAGFIGSCFVLQRVAAGDFVVNLDKLTYCGNPHNLAAVHDAENYRFVRGDIADKPLVRQLLETRQPDAIVNFAAETHVDRSIFDASAFVKTNVLGTENLLSVTKDWWQTLPAAKRTAFRFLQISTDEVFGSLGFGDPAFTEASPYRANSPYAASKASADLFVRAYHETHGLPTVVTHCSNNYGPRQFPEKLIPLIILNAIQGKSLPIYGKGQNIRDWLHVEDHCDALYRILQKAEPGSRYNIGGASERSNLYIVKKLCAILDAVLPKEDGSSYAKQITFVADRPGHDLRYGINGEKLENEIGWKPKHALEEGLRETVRWYLDHPEWVKSIETEEYRQWIRKNYGDTPCNGASGDSGERGVERRACR